MPFLKKVGHYANVAKAPFNPSLLTWEGINLIPSDVMSLTGAFDERMEVGCAWTSSAPNVVHYDSASETLQATGTGSVTLT